MIDYGGFAALAKEAKGRCLLLARHGRRPRIAEDDPTFGENLPITDDGREMALACGRALRAGPPAGEWAFWASRLRRTRLTAACVAEGLGVPDAPVGVSVEASIPGLWVADVAETHRHYFAEGSVPFTNRLMRDGWANGYRPIAESTRLALEWASTFDFGARVVFVSTHDVFLACLMQGLGVARFSSEDWVGFLQGCALFQRPDGTWRAEYCVPDLANWRNAFIQ